MRTAARNRGRPTDHCRRQRPLPAHRAARRRRARTDDRQVYGRSAVLGGRRQPKPGHSCPPGADFRAGLRRLRFSVTRRSRKRLVFRQHRRCTIRQPRAKLLLLHPFRLHGASPVEAVPRWVGRRRRRVEPSRDGTATKTMFSPQQDSRDQFHNRRAKLKPQGKCCGISTGLKIRRALINFCYAANRMPFLQVICECGVRYVNSLYVTSIP